MKLTRSLIEKIPAPVDYYAGIATWETGVPFNILLFSRLFSSSLYPERGHRPNLHRRFVLIFNLETVGSLIVDGQWHTLHPGECALIFPHQIHAFADIQSTELCWLFVTFDLARVEELHPLRHRILPIPNPCRDWAAQLIECRISHPGRAPFLTGMILNELLEATTLPRGKMPPAGLGLEKIIPKLHEILETEPALRIKQLAARVGLSEPHLRAEFRRRTQVSLGSYLRQFRLNRAVILLSTTSLTIGEVAMRCGFESLYSFSRSFRLAMGVSARDYRKELLQAPEAR